MIFFKHLWINFIFPLPSLCLIFINWEFMLLFLLIVFYFIWCQTKRNLETCPKEHHRYISEKELSKSSVFKHFWDFYHSFNFQNAKIIFNISCISELLSRKFNNLVVMLLKIKNTVLENYLILLNQSDSSIFFSIFIYFIF